MVRTESLLWGTTEAILIIGTNEISYCIAIKKFPSTGNDNNRLNMNEYQSNNN